MKILLYVDNIRSIPRTFAEGEQNTARKGFKYLTLEPGTVISFWACDGENEEFLRNARVTYIAAYEHYIDAPVELARRNHANLVDTHALSTLRQQLNLVQILNSCYQDSGGFNWESPITFIGFKS